MRRMDEKIHLVFFLSWYLIEEYCYSSEFIILIENLLLTTMLESLFWSDFQVMMVNSSVTIGIQYQIIWYNTRICFCKILNEFCEIIISDNCVGIVSTNILLCHNDFII